MPEFVISALGILESGCIVSSFNPIYTAHEISIQILDSGTKLIICTDENYNAIIEAVMISKKDIKIMCVHTDKTNSLDSRAINFSEAIDLSSKHFYKPIDVPDYHETAFLPYSSGTTGLPKGVCLTHRNILSNSEMLNVKLGSETLALPTTKDYQECIPCVLPFFHIYGWTVTLMSKLHLGCKIVTLPNFKPDTFLSCLKTHKGTLLHLVPPIGKNLLNLHI